LILLGGADGLHIEDLITMLQTNDSTTEQVISLLFFLFKMI